MTRIIGPFICTLLVVFSVSAQSGRRITPTPTPAPVVQDEELSYSESKPQKKRPVQVWPSLRGSTTSRAEATTPTTKDTIDAKPAPGTESEDFGKVETNLVTI